MNTPFVNSSPTERPFITSTPSTRGRPRGTVSGGLAATGAKRGRKPRGAFPIPALPSPRPLTQDPPPTTSLPTPLHWPTPATAGNISSTSTPTSASTAIASAAAPSGTASMIATSILNARDRLASDPTASRMQLSQAETTTTTTTTPSAAAAALFSQVQANPSLLNLPSSITPLLSLTNSTFPKLVADDDADGDDELFPAMADDDYSAQLSWQSQSKDNLKVLMDNFSPAQYERFEAYRRHALPKQAVRKVIQQATGQQVSQPVAQIVAGFAKVFVGEIIEKARSVQERRGDTGPLSPDHLREAYRLYQLETGRVGAARPLRSKRLFVR